jgi:hypothetical protein
VTNREKHPCADWLYLSPNDHQAALVRLMPICDKSTNPLASGLPQEAIKWFWRTELPRLAKDRGVRLQIEKRIDDLSTQESNSVGKNLPREYVQSMQKEKLKLELILAKFINLKQLQRLSR